MIWLSTFSNGFRQVKIKQTFCKIFFWPMLLLELGWHGGKKFAVSKPTKFTAGEEKTIQNREVESYDFQTNIDQAVYQKLKRSW